MDPLNHFLRGRPPTTARPLLGVTILLVEDSRFASDAYRIMCHRSGGRIRRADTLAAARKHLRTYQPTVIIVDIGLPDEPGTVLIEELSRSIPRVEVLLATSGNPDLEGIALEAGADGIIVKPIERVAEFQNAILRHMSKERQPPRPAIVSDDRVTPDPIALRDDLTHVRGILAGETSERDIRYVAHFLVGVARSSGDRELLDAAGDVESDDDPGDPLKTNLARLTALVDTRLTTTAQI